MQVVPATCFGLGIQLPTQHHCSHSDQDAKSGECRSFAGLLVGEDHRRDLAEEFPCSVVGLQSMGRSSSSIGPVFGRRQQVAGAWCDGIDGRDDWASQSSRDPLEAASKLIVAGCRARPICRG